MSATDVKGAGGSGRKMNPIKKVDTKQLLLNYGVAYYKAFLKQDKNVEQEILKEIIASNPNFGVENVVNRLQYLHKTFLTEQKKHIGTKKSSKWEYYAEMGNIFDTIEQQQVDLSGPSLDKSNAGDLPAVEKELGQQEVAAEIEKENVVKDSAQSEANDESKKEEDVEMKLVELEIKIESKEKEVVEMKVVQPEAKTESEMEKVENSNEDGGEGTEEKPMGSTAKEPR